ncbi:MULTISPECIES: extracellular matrix/biofilm biosynthesis regulator RemA family protein [Bacillus]|uniref:Putative regulatory protein BCG9842_A0044 n=1 Tax=Bacillus cereus (strain G9842) TaxID=405531 RepID=Y6144_BACC2|nr:MULTISPECIES: extracellular matrix/biofilm biosynthesis regulator RemA family protein [Bacillus]B7IZN7.1 RecName: Full=Putative regulatory protein BCG9842_A0044 [Bacillus cereus G9842]MBS9805870.1 DUF370 domain-containing protein [Bacillus toyonensis]ACK98718.1 protein Dvul_2085 [Bacillus cereus G9842]KUF34416.1 hypothetical protein AMR94_02125 [Bacillus sp. G3(2015)]MCU5508221.1 DUF370 domain-containing protein [Bacillus cereus]MDA1951615.1 DUF370 domain-containing protein [Bacillus cereu
MNNNIHFVDIGFSNYVDAGKILTVNRPDSSPIKRSLQHAKEAGRFLDLTQGKKTRSIITQSSNTGLIFTASAVQTSTIMNRIRETEVKQSKRMAGKLIEKSVEVGNQ